MLYFDFTFRSFYIFRAGKNLDTKKIEQTISPFLEAPNSTVASQSTHGEHRITCTILHHAIGGDLALGFEGLKNPDPEVCYFFEPNFRTTFFIFLAKILDDQHNSISNRKDEDISYDIKYFSEILGGRKHGPSPTSTFLGNVPSIPPMSPPIHDAL